MVGWSFWMNDVNVEAPIRSPAATNAVFGFAARYWFTTPPSTAAPPDGAIASSRPWKSLMLTRSMVTGTAAEFTPSTIGSWSLERYGVPGSVAPNM